MKTLNNEITIHRNDSFTIDKLIQNKDGSPYVISNELDNPYFLLTIANTRYQINSGDHQRYVKNYWLPVDGNIPRFSMTNKIVNIIGLKAHEPQDEPFVITSFDDINWAGTAQGKAWVVCDDRGDNVIYYEPEDCVFTDGTNYKYCTLDNTRSQVTWHKYECRIIKTIFREDTKNWQEQNYVYSIRLVDGSLAPAGSDQPIIVGNMVLTILPPTKLTVLNSIQGEL